MTKRWKVISAALLIGLQVFSGVLVSIPVAKAALSAVGPVNPTKGFPYWYKDVNGLALDLMEASDTFGISAPVEAGNPFSSQIGFGPEGFWWSAGARVDGTIPNQAEVVLALEAAFAGESAIDGEQSAFGRVRYRIDSLTPGATYTIRHPFGTVTEVAAADGTINVTNDIGCFAVNGVSSCDPANPLGSPLSQFNFAAALSSGIGPFLTWDTFNLDPAQTDPQLVNPANPTRQYVGNPAVTHAVTGSPIGQNLFRVEGPGLPGGAIETTLFTVTGRLAEAVPPVIDAIPNKTIQVNTPLSFTVTASDVNLDPIAFSITATSAVGNEAAATIDSATGAFAWTPTTAGTSTFTIGASDGTSTTTTVATVVVTDTAPVLSSIQVTPATANVIQGQTRQLTAVGLDGTGAQVSPAPTFTWTSSNGAFATVDASGIVTAVAPGLATITATSGAISGTADITVLAAQQIGGGLQASLPVEANTGFPLWYTDRNGLALELMEAADAFGISAPVEVGNPFSSQIGFGPEGFWYSADASIGNQALLVQAVEAAFAGESAVNGEQSAFGRVRIRVDVPEPGTYTVTYPYGQKTYVVDTVGAGLEINDTNDIGCFAIPGVSSCDPANPLGSQQSQFNFNAVGASEIGPFLPWDTFNINPSLTDPQLSNPANPSRKYLGNPAIAHAITGSPTGNNFFRVEGPNIGGAGVNVIETNLFTVTGRLADSGAPVITLNGANPDTVAQNAVYADPGATATDAFDGDVTAQIVTTGVPVDTTTTGAKTITYTVTDTAGNTATATRTVNVTGAPVPDTQAPVITLTGTNPVTVNQGTPYNDAGATALDNVDGDVSANIVTTGLPIDTAALGVHLVSYKVSDAAGNSTTINRTVSIVSPTPGAPALTTVNVQTPAPTIITGATQQVSIAALDQFGATIVPAPTVVLTTNDPAIATVDANGIVTAIAPGTATITATANGTVTGNTNIVVAAPDPNPVLTTLNIVSAASTVIVGASQQLAAAGIDQNNAAITPAPAITYTSSDPAIATVDVNGLVTAVAPGTVTITAANGGEIATCGLNVAAAAANDTTAPVITITGSNPATVIVGNPYNDAGATATDNVDGDLTANIVVTGLPIDTTTAGTHTVTYSVSDAAGNPAQATRTVNVNVDNNPNPNPVLTTINVTPANPSLAVGATTQLSAAALDQNGAAINPAPAITWTSSDPAKATVDANGLASGVAAGTSTITATSGAVSGNTTVTVTASNPNPTPTPTPKPEDKPQQGGNSKNDDNPHNLSPGQSTVQNLNTSGFLLAWATPTSGTSKILYGTNRKKLRAQATATSDNGVFSIAFTRLKKGKTYYFQIVNPDGSLGELKRVKIPKKGSAGGSSANLAPSNANIQNLSATGFQLNWNGNSGASKVRYGTNQKKLVAEVSADSSDGNFSTNFSGLKKGKTYYFQIVNSDGSLRQIFKVKIPKK